MMKHVFFLVAITIGLTSCGPSEPPTTEPSKSVVADTATPPPITEGHQVLYLKDGGRMEGELRAGKRVGPWPSYFANVAIRSRSTYADGLEEGPTEVFHENGMTYYSGAYHKGKSAGEWVFYDEQGKEQKRVMYDSLGVMVRE